MLRALDGVDWFGLFGPVNDESRPSNGCIAPKWNLELGNKHTVLKLNASSSCLDDPIAFSLLVESSCEIVMSVPSGEEQTVLHAKYPARIAEKKTKMNLRGHI